MNIKDYISLREQLQNVSGAFDCIKEAIADQDPTPNKRELKYQAELFLEYALALECLAYVCKHCYHWSQTIFTTDQLATVYHEQRLIMDTVIKLNNDYMKISAALGAVITPRASNTLRSIYVTQLGSLAIGYKQILGIEDRDMAVKKTN